MLSLQLPKHPWFYPSTHGTIRHVLTPTTQLSMVLPKYTGYHQTFSHSNHSTIHGFTQVYNTGYHQPCSHSNHSTSHGIPSVYRKPSGMFSLQPLNHLWFYPSIQDTIRHVLTLTTQPSMVLPKCTGYHQACSHSNHSTIHGFTPVYRISSSMFSLQPINHPGFYPSIQVIIRHVLTPTTQLSMVLPQYTGYHQASFQPLNHPWFYPSIQDTIRMFSLQPLNHPWFFASTCTVNCTATNHLPFKYSLSQIINKSMCSFLHIIIFLFFAII
jgi:hypothetical protein